MITEDGFYKSQIPSADDYYAEVRRLAALCPTDIEYTIIYNLMQRLCEDVTADMTFSNLFSRLSYVARHAGLTSDEECSVQNLRRRCHHIEGEGLSSLCYTSDLRLFAEFVARVLRQPMPSDLQHSLPLVPKHNSDKRSKDYYHCMRISVSKWNENFIYGKADDSEIGDVKIDYTGKETDNDMHYLSSMLREGITLNLLKAKVGKDNVLVPQSIILVPDFLIDVSTLAGCFMEYGHDARIFLLKRLDYHIDNAYSVLGNLASKFLDKLIQSHREENDVSYSECVKYAFAENPIPFAYVDLNSDFSFHDEGRRQFDNLKNLINNSLEQKYGFDLKKGLIEPSFICEALGLAGRMDLLQSDYTKLIEQKSGKRGGLKQDHHKETHYIQMMLYRAILEYNIGIKDSFADSYLLYSKYSDGLMLEKTYKKLLLEVLNTRNRIVALEIECAEGRSRDVLENIRADELAAQNKSGKLWTNYQKPQLIKLLEPFQTENNAGMTDTYLQQLAQTYFYRFHTFLCREHLQAKITTPGNVGRAFSNLWNLPVSVRREQGSIYLSLKIKEIIPAKTGDSSIGAVVLELPENENGFLSNFRQGDIVLLYSYDGSPDVRHQFLMRGRLKSQNMHQLVVELNNNQSNRDVFGHSDKVFALEHDYMEAGSGMLYSGLYSFLTGPDCRKQLLLGIREPRCSAVQPLYGHYGNMDILVQKERAAEELFFVIGPPGSGKTSCAIRSMVEEELYHKSDGKILLAAYTNKAADELCEMLETIIRDNPGVLNNYIRIGTELSSAEAYRRRLLANQCRNLFHTDEIISLIGANRVVVGTVTAVSNQRLLLKNCFFDVAFIDEASQLLEPHLLPLFFAKTSCGVKSCGMAVRKFVLVGDQKQLPAVVMQSSEKSVVTETLLREIGLTDCRNSLFERLLSLQQKHHRASLFHLLEKQGRMHPILFQFVNKYYYNGRLDCIPLEHQQRDITVLYPHAGSKRLSSLSAVLSSRRMAFFNCVSNDMNENDKVNVAEAGLVAECLISLRELYRLEGRTLTMEDIGIIVPYRNQISVIASKMAEYGLEGFDERSIDTVERYQGSQRDIIFYVFTVRRLFQLSFLSASTYVERNDAEKPYPVDRKLNVALTRAREQCFLIGNADLLSHNPMYKELIDLLKTQQCFFDETVSAPFTDPLQKQ